MQFCAVQFQPFILNWLKSHCTKISACTTFWNTLQQDRMVLFLPCNVVQANTLHLRPVFEVSFILHWQQLQIARAVWLECSVRKRTGTPALHFRPFEPIDPSVPKKLMYFFKLHATQCSGVNSPFNNNWNLHLERCRVCIIVWQNARGVWMGNMAVFMFLSHWFLWAKFTLILICFSVRFSSAVAVRFWCNVDTAATIVLGKKTVGIVRE